MVLVCTCGAKLKIADEKLTDAGVRIKCPKCATVHLARKPAPAAAPAMPWFAPEPAASAPEPGPPQPRPVSAAAPSAAPPETAPAPAMPWFAPPPADAPAAAPSPKQPQPAPASATRPPASPASPAMPWFAAEPAERSSAPAAAAPVVLVAHDSAVVVDMIRGVVSGAGLTVEHAPDGLDALKKAAALKPQVMIVDVGLTGIYGFELCERLKGDPETRGIKIILLSSVYGLTAYKRNPVTLYGADDYIEKHHIPDKLVSKIQDLLAGKKPAAPALPADEPQKPAAPAPVTLTPRPEPKERPAEPAALTPQAPPARKPPVPASDDVLPKVPVTLDGTRRLTPPPVAAPAAPAAKAPTPPTSQARAAEQDASVKLDAAFFEQDEYKAPVKEPFRAAPDAVEVEKARRFARLVVSDIALYNQEAVAEGIAKGTFYELLNDDITEGRALYDKRVPEAIRASKDYYQEAFDDFIASQKKKQR